jgi:hypothetical protein
LLIVYSKDVGCNSFASSRKARLLNLKLLQILINEKTLTCEGVKGARVDLYNKSILHLAINFVTEVVNKGFFIYI